MHNMVHVFIILYMYLQRGKHSKHTVGVKAICRYVPVFMHAIL